MIINFSFNTTQMATCSSNILLDTKSELFGSAFTNYLFDDIFFLSNIYFIDMEETVTSRIMTKMCIDLDFLGWVLTATKWFWIPT